MTIIETLLLSLFALTNPTVPPADEAPPVTETNNQAKGDEAEAIPAAKDEPARKFRAARILQISNGY